MFRGEVTLHLRTQSGGWESLRQGVNGNPGMRAEELPEQDGERTAKPELWTRSPGWLWDVCALLLPLAACTPWLRRAWGLFCSSEERWFGLAVVGIVLFASVTWNMLRAWWGRGRSAPGDFGTVTYARLRAATGLLLCSSLCMLLAAVWSSPWLGVLAAIGSLVAWALGRFPRISGPKILAWGGMLLFVMPLPGRWELEFPGWLQQTAGYLTGGFLDLVGIPHLRFGDSLELRDLSFAFSEAGRGPWSVWALAGLLVATVFLRRAPLLVALVSLGFLPLLGLTLYLNRYLGLVYLQQWWGITALTGSNFFWLCLGCLAFVYLGWLLLDLTLRFLLDAVEPEVPELAPVYDRLNKLLCWPRESPFDPPDDPEEEEALPKEPVQVSLPAVSGQLTGRLRTALLLATALSLFAGIIVFSGRARGGLATYYPASFPRSDAARLQELPGREALPETVDGWLRTTFKSPGGLSAATEASPEQLRFCWTYLAGTRTFDFSLQLPFWGEPNPVAAFARQGWEVTEVEVHLDSEGTETAWLELFLRNSSGGRAWVCCSSFDSRGRPYTEWPELARVLPNRPTALDVVARMVGAPPPLTMQLQLFCDAVAWTDKPELARLRRVYLQLRKKLLDDRAQQNWSLEN